MGKIATAPLATRAEQDAYYRKHRLDIMRKLGHTSYVAGVEFVLLSVNQDGDSELFATSLFQSKLKDWFKPKTLDEARQLAVEAAQRNKALKAQDEAFSNSDQAFSAEGSAVSITLGSSLKNNRPRSSSSASSAGDGQSNKQQSNEQGQATTHKNLTRRHSDVYVSTTSPRRLSTSSAPILKPVTFTPAALDKWYKTCFNSLSDKVSKLVLRDWIKVVEPKKLKNFPYTLGDSSKPPWWPESVRHKDPDHLYKPERVKMFNLIAREKAESIDDLAMGTAKSSAMIPQNQNETLKEIYKVAKEERKAKNALAEGEQLRFLTVLLPESSIQEVLPDLDTATLPSPRTDTKSVSPVSGRPSDSAAVFRPRDAIRPYPMSRSRSSGLSEDSSSRSLSRSLSHRGAEGGAFQRARTVYNSPSAKTNDRRPLSASATESQPLSFGNLGFNNSAHRTDTFSSRTSFSESSRASPVMVRTNSQGFTSPRLATDSNPSSGQATSIRSFDSPALVALPRDSPTVPLDLSTFRLSQPDHAPMSDPLPYQPSFSPLFEADSQSLQERTHSGPTQYTISSSSRDLYTHIETQHHDAHHDARLSEANAEAHAAAMASAADFTNPLNTPPIPYSEDHHQAYAGPIATAQQQSPYLPSNSSEMVWSPETFSNGQQHFNLAGGLFVQQPDTVETFNRRSPEQQQYASHPYNGAVPLAPGRPDNTHWQQTGPSNHYTPYTPDLRHLHSQQQTNPGTNSTSDFERTHERYPIPTIIDEHGQPYAGY